MDRLKYWSFLWPYFSSRREPSVLKTGRRFPSMLYRALLGILFRKEKSKYTVTLINRCNLILPRIQHKVGLLVLRTVFAIGL